MKKGIYFIKKMWEVQAKERKRASVDSVYVFLEINTYSIKKKNTMINYSIIDNE